MNNQFTKRSGVLMISLFLFSLVSFSQFKDVDFLRSAPTDGVKYLQAYLSPWANAFGAGLNGGWYNTAKPHKFGGFDLTLSASAGVVPTSAETFDVSRIGLSSSLSGTGLVSTVAGPDKSGPLLTLKNSQGATLTTFNAPKGANWRYIPVPTAQIGVGLPFGTELKVRFIPKIKIKDGDVSMWGIGLVHSIMQYLPGNKLSPFDVSLFAGYSKLQGNVPLGLDPDPDVSQAYTTPYNTTTAFDNQKLKMSVQALNVSAIASVKLSVLTFYGGLGYCRSKTLMSLSGNFPTPVLVTPVSAAPYVQYNNDGVKKGSDFPKLDIENFSGLRANIGFRLKLSVITLHADYTRAQYNVLTAGLGISVR
jgi:hypothetical protein